MPKVPEPREENAVFIMLDTWMDEEEEEGQPAVETGRGKEVIN